MRPDAFSVRRHGHANMEGCRACTRRSAATRACLPCGCVASPRDGRRGGWPCVQPWRPSPAHRAARRLLGRGARRTDHLLRQRWRRDLGRGVELADRRVEVVVTSGSGAGEPAQAAGELGDGRGRACRLVFEELPPLRSGGVDAELRGSLLAERGGVARSKGREVDANQLVEIIRSRRAEASGGSASGVHGCEA